MILEMISERLVSSLVSKMLAKHGYKLKPQCMEVKAGRPWHSHWPTNLNKWLAPGSVSKHCLKKQSRKQLREPEVDLWPPQVYAQLSVKHTHRDKERLRLRLILKAESTLTLMSGIQ